MMRVAGLLALYAVIASLDLPLLLRKRRKKELFVYLGILVLALTLSVLQTLRMPIVGLNRVIEAIVDGLKSMFGL